MFRSKNNYTSLADIYNGYIQAVNECLSNEGREARKLGGGGGGGGGRSGVSMSFESVPAMYSPESELPKQIFNDLKGFEWAEQSINILASKGIISGDGFGNFRPDSAITREEFIKILVGAFELKGEPFEVNFNDVDRNEWFYTPISIAYGNGIINGIDSENFGVGLPINRQDLATIIYRTAKFIGILLPAGNSYFNDNDQISDYAKEAVAALYSAGIINGMPDGSFAPGNTASRAQAAKIIYGLMETMGK